MMSSLSGPLWKRIGEESLWGRRGIIKVNLLWLPLAVALFQKSAETRQNGAAVSFQVFLAAVFWLSASILANNLGDCRDDRAAGKPRWVCGLPRGAGAAVVVLLIGAGFAVLYFSKSPAAAKGIYAGAVALGLAYSVRPFRFKERGAWGIFIYSLACACVYAILPLVWLKGNPAAFFFLAPAVLLDKWVNLHFHQVVDYEADRARGVGTLAVELGMTRARRWLKGCAGVASLWLLLALVYSASFLPRILGYVFFGGSAIVLLLVVYISLRRSFFLSLSIFRRELPLFYLALTYIVFRLLPLLLFFVLALQEKLLWTIFGISLALVALESRLLLGTSPHNLISSK
jgi:4-hydroxybenzoate polyprenyltransferase